MNKVLVTGGCGFLGSNVAAHFLREKWRVIVFDGLLRKGGQSNLDWLRTLATPEQFDYVAGDIADEAKIQELFRQHGPFDYVCHLAGQVAMTTSLSDPRRDMLTNIVGTFN